MELSKWSEKIEELNWTPDSQENTILAAGLVTLTSRLRIVTKVHEFGFFLSRGLMTELIDDY